jgi:hypothetical protein
VSRIFEANKEVRCSIARSQFPLRRRSGSAVTNDPLLLRGVDGRSVFVEWGIETRAMPCLIANASRIGA